MRFRLVLSVVGVLLLPLTLVADSSNGRLVAQGQSAKSNRKSDKTKGETKSETPSAKPKPGVPVSAEREAAVLAFLEQHHAELAELLRNLKTNNSKEYERAIRDLSRTSERLSQFRERDLERYELELKLWQAQSRIDLMAARLKMSSNDELRNQLRQGLNEQVDLKQALLQLERRRTAEKLRKMDEQLGELDRSRLEMVERQLRTLIGASEKPATKNGEKGSDKTKPKAKK